MLSLKIQVKLKMETIDFSQRFPNLYRNLRENDGQIILLEKRVEDLENRAKRGRSYKVPPMILNGRRRVMEAGLISGPDYILGLSPTNALFPYSNGIRLNVEKKLRLDIWAFLEKEWNERKDQCSIVIPMDGFMREVISYEKTKEEERYATGTYLNSMALKIGDHAARDFFVQQHSSLKDDDWVKKGEYFLNIGKRLFKDLSREFKEGKKEEKTELIQPYKVSGPIL